MSFRKPGLVWGFSSCCCKAICPPPLCAAGREPWTSHSYLLESTQFPEGNAAARLAPGSCCGLATGQALAVTPEWPDFCGIRHPRRLLVTGDRFHGSQTPQGAGPQPQQTEALWVGPESLSLARAGPGGLSSLLPPPLGSLQSTSSRGRGPEKLPRRQTRVAQAHSQAPV